MKQYASRPVRPFSQYPFLALLPLFAGGIILQQYLPCLSSLTWLLVTASALIISSIFSFRPGIHKVRGIMRTITLAFTCLLAGATTGAVTCVTKSNSWYGHFLHQAIAAKLRVTDIPEIKTKTVMIPASVDAVCVSGKWIKTEGQVRLFIYRKNCSISFRPGQVLLIPNKLVALKSSGNPFVFDIVHLYERRGIFHQVFLPENEIKLIHSEGTGPDALQRLKHTLQQSIVENVQDSTTRALIAATLLNERTELNSNLMEAYSNTGIIHIIAISGMHIVLLATSILWLLRIIPGQKLKAIKYGIAIVVVWLYVALTGFPPSAVRAAVMFTLLAVGISANRVTNAINIWAAAGILILAYNPYWLYDTGIQLSFLAVLSILLFYTPVKNWLAPKTKAGRWLWEVIAVSIAAQLLVFPLVIYYFHQFPLFGIAANVPAALYSTLLMFGAMLLFALHAIGLPAAWLGSMLTLLTRAFNNIIIMLSDQTPELMRNIQMGTLQYWLMMGIVIVLCLCCMRKKGIYLLAGLSLSIIYVAGLIIRDVCEAQQQRIVVYNSNRLSLADVFSGQKATHLFAATTDQVKYILKPAMLGYGTTYEIWDTADRTRCVILGKTVTLLLGKNNVHPDTRFSVDFLVIGNHCVFRPEAWISAFRPRLIILDGSVPERKAFRWKAALQQSGVRVHYVREDGAWIYPDS